MQRGAWGVAAVAAIVLLTAFPSGPAAPPAVDPNGTVVSGDITGNVTWTVAGNPYWILGLVNVTAGSTLTVEEGVQARFAQANLRVRGALVVAGSEALPVTFATNGTCNPSQNLVQISASAAGSIFARHWEIDCGYLSASTSGDILLAGVLFPNAVSGINIDRAGTVSITRTSLEVAGNGIEADDFLSGNFSHNVIRGKTLAADGIWASPAPGSNLTIVGNEITGFTFGIDVWAAPGALIADNVLGSLGTGNSVSGIRVTHSPDVVISGNRIRGMVAGVGIVLAGTSVRALVIRNYISAGDGSGGITDSSSAGDHLIVDNVIVDNYWHGIRLSSATGDTVTRNLIEGNAVRGIVVLGGSGHRVYHNRIRYNGVQAVDTSSGTSWDDGYPSGGNWWSDYVGDDLYRGPFQDIPGPDGIGDASYVIDADSQDSYPFHSVPAPGVPRELTASPFAGIVRLAWRAAPMADAYDVYTADTPTGFDFSAPMRLGNVTSWEDFDAVAPGPHYYVVRGHNTTLNRTGPTSNTAGAWTAVFPAGRTTLSLPFSTYPWMDYGAPGWVNTAGELAAATGASLAYMESGHWRIVPGDGDPDRTLRPGEGYVADFPIPTWVTLVGLPAAMIDYAEWPPYPLRGFDPDTTARSVSASASGDDVVLAWDQPPEVTGNGTYEVYASRTPAGLRGYLGADHELLATVPSLGPGRASFTHGGALASAPAWYYLVVPVRATYWRGASAYSVGVVAEDLPAGWSAVGLPLWPYANGTFVPTTVSFLIAGPEFHGAVWFDAARGDWVAHAAWMPPGTYDAPFAMVMAVQVDVAVPTRIVFVGV